MDLGRIVQAFEQGGTPLVRTDFSDDDAWELVVYELTKQDDEGTEPHVTVVDDRALAGVTGDALGSAFHGQGLSYGYVALADARSMAEAVAGGELTVDYVDLSVADEEDSELFESFPGRTFRCAARRFASIEVNLSLGNMDFHEFADSVESDGVFRGFPSDG
ncbi:DUF6924 domain-containing protein [Nocardioides dilutus]